VFYPGVASMEWTQVGTEHGGARAMRNGENCASCHDEETADMGKKIVSGQKLEPDAASVKGKAASIAVAVQAAYDATNFYLRFAWKQPPSAGGKKMDEKNAVKVAVMLDDGKVEYGAMGGCWASCHHDLRSMPDVSADARTHPRAKELDIRSNGPTKYLKESRTAIETRSRPMGGWDKLKPEAEYAQLLKDGKTYNFGFAIHDDHHDWRYHHVSLGYTLGLDDAKATVKAVKQ